MVTGGPTASTTRSAVGVKAYGARHGIPPHTSTTTPFACRNSDFCVRALGWLRGSSWGSWPPGGGVFVVGGGQVQSAARPASAAGRTVFVRVQAPHRALSTGGVTQIAAAARRAGLG